jgi:hypothetical protein
VLQCDRVFTHPGDCERGSRPTPTLGCTDCGTPFLTEAGKHTGPFTLQSTAGRDNIKTTTRYADPQANAVQTLFARLAALRSEKLLSNGTTQKVVTKWIHLTEAPGGVPNK